LQFHHAVKGLKPYTYIYAYIIITINDDKRYEKKSHETKKENEKKMSSRKIRCLRDTPICGGVSEIFLFFFVEILGTFSKLKKISIEGGQHPKLLIPWYSSGTVKKDNRKLELEISVSKFNDTQILIIYGDSIIYSGSNFVYSINCKCFSEK